MTSPARVHVGKPLNWHLVALLLVGGLLLSCSASHAQTSTPPAVGEVPDTLQPPKPGGHDYIHLLSEAVNPATGNLTIRIQLPVPKGRGITPPAVVAYNSGEMSSLIDPNGSIVWSTDPSNPEGQASGWGTSSSRLLSTSSSLWHFKSPIYNGGTPAQDCWFTSGFHLTDLNGVAHTFVNGGQAPADGTTSCATTIVNVPYQSSDLEMYGTFESDAAQVLSNGTAITLDAIDVQGNTYTVSNGYSGMEDRNGNTLTSNDTAGRPLTLQIPALSTSGVIQSGTYTVGGLAYTINTMTATTNYTVSWTKYEENGVIDCPWQANAPTNNATVTVISSLQLPNGQKYTFNYDPTYGTISQITYPDGGWVKYTWGLPSGYQGVSYFPGISQSTGGQVSGGCQAEFQLPVVTERQVSFDGTNVAQTQTFSYSTGWDLNGFDWTGKKTDIWTTDNTTGGGGKQFLTEYNYVPAPDNVASPAYSSGQLYAGIPVESVVLRYDWGNSSTPVETTWEAWYNEFQKACEVHRLNNGQNYGQYYQYSYGLLSDEKEYDLTPETALTLTCMQGSSNAPSATATRETKTYFYQFASPVPPNLTFAKPCAVVTLGSTGAEIAETDFGYDENGVQAVANLTGHDETNFGSGFAGTPQPYSSTTCMSGNPTAPIGRGNLTTVIKKCLGCTDSVTKSVYDETGQVVQVNDPCTGGACADMYGTDHSTYYFYNDNYPGGGPSGGLNSDTYVTKIIEPSTATTHTSTYTYSWLQGDLLSSTDVENSATTNYHYSDSLDRLTETDYPDGGKTTLQYTDGTFSLSSDIPNVKTTTLISSSSSVSKTTEAVSDGMGHVVRTIVEEASPSNNDIVDMTYDGEGHVSSRTNPYRGSPGSNNTTYFWYDGLGRPIAQQQADGSWLNLCYSDVGSTLPSGATSPCQSHLGSQTTGTWVDSTDETGRRWQRTTDSFGRLTEVMEPDSSNNDTIETDYQYDGLNDLLSVTQWGGPSGTSGARVRNFSYDSLARLLTAANPETGSISYSYDPNGNLATKSDSRGAGVWYCYDVLNRVLGKAYTSQSNCGSMSSPVATYAYDTSSVSGASETDGRLTSAIGYNGTTVVAESQPYAYDAMGRVLNEQQCTPLNCTGTPGLVQYTYNQEGDIASLTNGVSNPSLTVSYQYDQVGRINQIWSTIPWNDSNHPTTLFNNPNYGPFGLLNANLDISTSGGQSNLTLARTYDNRMRISSETDTGQNVVAPTPGTATLTINGSEQSTGTPTVATGSVAIHGSEQNTQVQTAAATSSTGSISIVGSEQQKVVAATSGTGSVSISGSEQSTTIYVPCGPYGQTCPQTVYDSGTVTVTINGTQYQTGYSQNTQASDIASSLVTEINNGGFETATLNGTTVSIKAVATGSSSNYTLSATSATTNGNFSQPSFTAGASGSSLTGGTNSYSIYDHGTASATINGCTGSYGWGQNDTPSTLASGLASSIGGTCGSFLSVGSSGSVVSLTSKSTGTSTNWAISTGMTYDTTDFSSSSFSASPSGMSGGKNATDSTVYDNGTVTITVNGHSDSASYGQNDTTGTIATSLASAIQGDSGSPVTATASGSTVNLTTKSTGSTVNYSLTASDTYNTTNFSTASFTGSPSGSTLTGGSNNGGTTVYDSGTVSLTINGTTKTVSYGQSDTASTVASKLSSAFSGNSSVTVSNSGGSLNVTATTGGTGTDYAYQFAETYDTSHFGSPSFSGSPSSGNLSGGANGSSSPATVYSYNISTSGGGSGYMPNGDVQAFNDSVMGTWSFSYDNMNRLTAGSASSGTFAGYNDCFTYDAFGNRTVEAYSTTGCGNSPTPTTWANYNSSNQITGTNLMPAGYVYDAAGNVTNDGANQYLYDNEERICAVKNLTSGTLMAYIYDAEGNRVAKGTLTSWPSACPAASAITLTASYVLGPGGEQLSESGSQGWQYSYFYANGKLLGYYSNSMTYFVLNDWLGTKRAVILADGALNTCWSSLAYGNNLAPCPQAGGSDPSGLHYTGKERDTESGNDYFGARYYNAAMGRWMSPDWSVAAQAVPYATFDDPQTLNLYGYLADNPLVKVDADGHEWLCVPCAVQKAKQFAAEHPRTMQALKGAGEAVAGGAGVAVGATAEVSSGALATAAVIVELQGSTALATKGVVDIIGAATKTDVSEGTKGIDSVANPAAQVTTAITGNMEKGAQAGDVADALTTVATVSDLAKGSAALKTLKAGLAGQSLVGGAIGAHDLYKHSQQQQPHDLVCSGGPATGQCSATTGGNASQLNGGKF